MISSHQFSHYLRLLQHPDQRQRIDALQDMFFLLLRGELLHPNQWERLIPVLVTNIAYSNDDTLRRWGYQVGSFSINNNQLLVDYCISNFDKEKDAENRSWIAALLSKNLPKESFYKVLSQNDHRLTHENIALATYLFTDYSTVNVRSVLKNSDPLSLMWLASIGAYKNIADHNNREVIITPKELSELTSATGNDEVLKHVMYAFFLQKSFNIQELQFSPFEHDKMGNQQKKWFFSLIWKDSEFFFKNIDYFRVLLSEKHLFQCINPEVRIGLARGLAGSKFSKEISNNILEWYSHEDRPSILYYLLKYFQRYQYFSDDYKEIVAYQREKGQDTLKELVSDHEKGEVESIQSGVEQINKFYIISIGDIIMNINIDNAMQVNNFEGNNNKASLELKTENLEVFESELKRVMRQCNDDEKKELEVAIAALNKRDNEGFKAALKRVVELGSNIFSNITADILVAYMRANGIIP